MTTAGASEASPIHTISAPTIESAEQTLHWVRRAYGDRAALAVSFGGLGGIVLLDIALRIDPRIPVYYLDTGLLFDETIAFVAQVEARYGISVTAVRPELTVVEQAARYGDALWAREPDACCAMRKVEPQRAFLANYDAWITGLHTTALATRTDLPRVSWDARSNVVKVSPLARFRDADLAAYVDERNLPVNPLHAQGFPSLGCIPCTRRVATGEDPRSGRWPGFAKTECGLHAPATAAVEA